jgi:hypothetical protein
MEVSARPSIVYHITEEDCFSSQVDNIVTETSPDDCRLYFPPAYAQDGFIHATDVATDLIAIGNHFYKSSTKNWICLEIDITLLNCETKFEERKYCLLGMSIFITLISNTHCSGTCCWHSITHHRQD